MGDLGHLKGQEESLCDQVGLGGEGGGKEKWREEGTGTPEGWLGEGRGSHDQRVPPTVWGSVRPGRDLQGIRGSEGMQLASPPTAQAPVSLLGSQA